MRVRILTNSLASQDVPAVNSHYKHFRKPLVEAGVELYEIRPDAAILRTVVDTPPTRAEFMGLHTKALAVDRRRVFIGSMNLDPRSMELNSEMGAVIESADFGEKLAGLIERNLQPENSWKVELDPEGELRWVAGDQVLHRPAGAELLAAGSGRAVHALPEEPLLTGTAQPHASRAGPGQSMPTVASTRKKSRPRRRSSVVPGRLSSGVRSKSSLAATAARQAM